MDVSSGVVNLEIEVPVGATAEVHLDGGHSHRIETVDSGIHGFQWVH